MTRRWPSDELPPDVAALLDAERDVAAPPADVEARVFAKLAATVGLPTPPSPPSPPASAPATSSASTAVSTQAGLAGGAGISTPLLIGGSVIALGAAAVTAALWWSAPQASVVDAPDAVPQAAPPPQLSAPDHTAGAAGEEPLEDETPSEAPAVEEPWVFDTVEIPSREPRRRTRRPSVDTLAAERSLLDEARQALAAGADASALAQLDLHRARYPRGKLVEEREALSIIALARSGRFDEARSRARRFEARFPQSLHGAAVRAVVEAR